MTTANEPRGDALSRIERAASCTRAMLAACEAEDWAALDALERERAWWLGEGLPAATTNTEAAELVERLEALDALNRALLVRVEGERDAAALALRRGRRARVYAAFQDGARALGAA